MSADPLVDGIDREILTPVVRRVLKSDTVDLLDYQVRPAGPVFSPQTGGVYRFDGTARLGDRVLPWSVVLKVSRRVTRVEADAPTSTHYWKRELLAYQSGLLDELSGGLVAPRCLGVVEMPDRDTWIWLEAIDDVYEHRWTLRRDGLAARHLGQLNGAYLAGRPLPAFRWLTDGSPVRFWGDWFAPCFARYPELRGHPYVLRQWPGDVADRTLRLFAERRTLLDALDRLPRTFCHKDAFRRNLLARLREDGQEETVAVDWAFVGIGVLGEELAPMVAASAQFFEVEPEHLRELDGTVFDGYLAGLRDAGWTGDARLPRFGYSAASALRYGLDAAGLLVAGDEGFRAVWERGTEHLFEEILDRRAELQRYLLDLADEARDLLPLVEEVDAEQAA